MADSNLQRRDSSHAFDHDPFAELTRIMGADPRGGDTQRTDDPFDIDLERELLGGFEDEAGASETGSADELEDPPLADLDAQSEQGADEYLRSAPEEPDTAFDAAGEADFDSIGREQSEPDSALAAGEAQPEAAAWESAAHYEPQHEPEALGDDADDVLGLAEVDMDFGELDFADDEPVQTSAAEEVGDDTRFELQAASFPADQPNIEDELARLLAGDPSSDGADETFDTGQPHAADDYAAGRDTPHTPLYGRANFSDVNAGAWADDGWQAHDEQHEQPEQEQAVEPAADEAPADEKPSDPFAVFTSIAPAMPQLRRTTASATAAIGLAPLPAADVPEIETVEVAESAVPAQDDLGLPEMPYDDPAPAYAEFDAEFASVFGTDGPTDREAAREAAHGPSEDEFFAEAVGLSTAATASSWTNSGQPQTGATDGYGAYGDALHSKEGETAAPVAPVVVDRRRKGLTVAFAVLGVAVLGGLGAFALSFGGGDTSDEPVLVKADVEPLKVKPENPGGLSVPNQDSKAYERAQGVVDDAPPAQERLVTTAEEPVNLAVADERGTMLPGVGAEEPAMAAPATSAGEEVTPAMTDAPETAVSQVTPKSEERLEATPEPDGVGAAEDLAIVQPRKVRTMIVRPDGTLVPREDPAEEAQAAETRTTEAASTDAASQQQTQPASGAVAAAEPAAAAASAIERAAGGAPVANAEQQAAGAPQQGVQERQATAGEIEQAVVTPETGPIVPQRPADQPATTAARSAPQPAARQQVAQAAPAAARNQPAAAVGGAAGEWSMQIASQPTVEAAQATYQELARRYGDVIGGRGVNIVKAEIPNKGTYFRVRIPSASRDDAIALCEKYKAVGGSCFVSK